MVLSKFYFMNMYKLKIKTSQGEKVVGIKSLLEGIMEATNPIFKWEDLRVKSILGIVT